MQAQPSAQPTPAAVGSVGSADSAGAGPAQKKGGVQEGMHGPHTSACIPIPNLVQAARSSVAILHAGLPGCLSCGECCEGQWICSYCCD
jgi:hypothetical protein